MMQVERGFGIPNVIFYYWAPNVHEIAYWISMPEDQSSLEWGNMERSLNDPANLESLVCTLPDTYLIPDAGNPVIKNLGTV